jgi:hypothetical protein
VPPEPWKYLVHHYAVFLVSWVLPFLVQRWDRRRLTPEQDARAWNAASWGAAIYGAFFVGSWASMIPWCWVTRHEWSYWKTRGLAYALGRSVLLLLAGLVAALLVLAVLVGIDMGLVALLGLPD